MLRGNAMATKNLIVHTLWIIQMWQIPRTKIPIQNCLSYGFQKRVGIRNEKSAKPYISRFLRLSESLVIQKWYCIRLSHIISYKRKPLSFEHLVHSREVFFMPIFWQRDTVNFVVQILQTFAFWKLFSKKRLTFTAPCSLQVRGILFADLTNIRFWKVFSEIYLIFTFSRSIQVRGIFRQFLQTCKFLKLFSILVVRKCHSLSQLLEVFLHKE